MSEKLKLAIEPRPASTWGITLANLLPKKKWDEIRHQVYFEADYECVICEARHRRLHAHEIWKFDDRKKIQRLVDIECCCVLCHNVHHFGRSTQVYSKKYQKELANHWCAVNGLTMKDFEVHLIEVRTLSRKRADIMYKVKVGKYDLY